MNVNFEDAITPLIESIVEPEEDVSIALKSKTFFQIFFMGFFAACIY